MTGDEVVYRIYEKTSRELVVVCVQYFDLLDYKEDQWLTDHKDDPIEFKTEKEAKLFLKILTETMSTAEFGRMIAKLLALAGEKQW